MVDCDTVQRDDMIDRYILRQLSPEEQEAFEEHYFGCDRCFRELQQTQKLILILKEGYKLKKGSTAKRVLSDKKKRGIYVEGENEKLHYAEGEISETE